MRTSSLKTVLFSGFIGLACFSSNAQAECVPGVDPCAPKKALGEWEKSLSLGFNMTSGNTDTTLLNLGGKAHKEKDADIWDFSAAYSFGEDDNSVNAKGDNTTKNDFRAGARWDHLLNDRLYAGLGTSFLYDEISDIDYRVSVDPGLGYYFLKDNTYKLRAEVGPSYVFEKQGGQSNDYLAPRIGERFEWAITCTSKIFQSAEFIWDIDDSDNYIINAEVGAEAALSTKLALVLLVRESYDNVPAAGREKEDLAVITALKVAL